MFSGWMDFLQFFTTSINELSTGYGYGCGGPTPYWVIQFPIDTCHAQCDLVLIRICLNFEY